MVTLKKAPKPKRVKVFRPKKTPQKTYSSTPKPPQKQGFSFIPKASAMPAPFIMSSVTVGVKKTLQKMPQVLGQAGLQPARAKKGKKIYRPPASLLEPSSLGVIKAGNGTPKYSPSYKLFAKKRPDRVFGKLAAATRLEQSNVMQFSPKMQQHKITPTQFTAITPGGPKLGLSEMYRTKTRYDKMGTKRTVANAQLVQGVPPTVRTTSTPGEQLAHSTYTKFIGGDKKPESSFKQKTLFGVAGATAVGTGLFDQVNSFFNPFPEAHASVGGAAVGVIKNFFKYNPNGTYQQFLTHMGQGKRGNAAMKKLFQEQKKLQQQQQTITPAPLQTTKPGLSDNKQKGWLLGGLATGLGGAAVVGAVNQGGFLTSPAQETPPLLVDPGIVNVVTDEEFPLPPPPATGIGTTVGQRNLQAEQDAAMLGMQTAAATSSELAPGDRRTYAADDIDKSFTKVTYTTYVPQFNEETGVQAKGSTKEISQWMRFTGNMTEDKFLASQATVLKNKQQNDTHRELLSVLGAIDPNTSTGMHDKAKAAKKFYKDNPSLGRAPQQWNVLFEATKPSSQAVYKKALEEHYSATPEGVFVGYTDADGNPIVNAQGKPLGITHKSTKMERPTYKVDEHGNKTSERVPTWLYPTSVVDTTPPPETEIGGTTLSATSPSAANAPITTHVPENWMTATDDKGVSVASTLTGLQNNNPQFEAVQEWDGDRYVFDGVNWWPEDQYITIRNTATS